MIDGEGLALLADFGMKHFETCGERPGITFAMDGDELVALVWCFRCDAIGEFKPTAADLRQACEVADRWMWPTTNEDLQTEEGQQVLAKIMLDIAQGRDPSVPRLQRP